MLRSHEEEGRKSVHISIIEKHYIKEKSSATITRSFSHEVSMVLLITHLKIILGLSKYSFLHVGPLPQKMSKKQYIKSKS